MIHQIGLPGEFDRAYWPHTLTTFAAPHSHFYSRAVCTYSTTLAVHRECPTVLTCAFRELTPSGPETSASWTSVQPQVISDGFPSTSQAPCYKEPMIFHKRVHFRQRADLAEAQFRVHDPVSREATFRGRLRGSIQTSSTSIARAMHT